MRKVNVKISIVLIAVISTLISGTASAATPKPTTKATPTATATAAALPPITIDPTKTKTLKITSKDTVVFKVDDVEGWNALVSNVKVLSFDAGGTKNGAAFNPSVKAVKAGTSWVVLKKYDKLIAAIKITVA